MDTLFAEGQRRYVESLSSYARQFLGRMKKPEVDLIQGICPAISIEQHTASGSSRSTVGSMTEINDYLRLLFARAGRTYSPISGKEVKKHQVKDVVDYFNTLQQGTKVFILAPIQTRYPDRKALKEIEMLIQKGYNRYMLNGEMGHLEEWLDQNKKYKGTVVKLREEGLFLLLDRLVKSEENQDQVSRLADSVGLAFSEFYGECRLVVDGEVQDFNNRFELDGISFISPNVHLFNSNNPLGACKNCDGFGKVQGISEEKVIPNPGKSIYEGAVACWSGEKGLNWLNRFIEKSASKKFSIHKPYAELSQEEQDLLWNGDKGIKGIYDYFKELESKLYKIQNRVILSRFRGRTPCPECHGTRLRKEASYVRVGDASFVDLYQKPVNELLDIIERLDLDEYQQAISERLLLEVKVRLKTLIQLGLDYLHLDRRAGTLSGGETQRIQLTRMLASTLTDSMYILDEPSIGLHPRDTEKLTEVLKNLRDLGNTLIVVEHEEDVIRNADYIVEIGPMAGSHGGEVVYQGSFKKFVSKRSKSITAQYLRDELEIPVPTMRRKPVQFVEILQARKHNLKGIDVKIGLQCITVVSGVSGSGKSTLVKDILVHELQNKLQGISMTKNVGAAAIAGDYEMISEVEFISQNPLGRSSRSNPATYVNAYDHIRHLMASQQYAKVSGLTARDFSFNVSGGRCEACKGEGEIVIEMQFLADVKLPCEECKGKKFQSHVLDVKFRDKNIYDILNLSIEASLDFFEGEKKIINKLQPLMDVGLGYVQLGQSSSTLSGGEAQRVKLASFLANHKKGVHNLFVFDEPTTGLHFHDINKLMAAFNALVEKGHSVLIVEHNLDVIKSADWLIDLGPEGGIKGGQLLYQGAPEGLLKVKDSYTGKYLKEKLKP